MPPCAMREEADEAPEQKSARSISRVSTPCRVRSRNVPIPLMPPPIIRTVGEWELSEVRVSFRFMFFYSIQSKVLVTAFFQPAKSELRFSADIDGFHCLSMPQFERNSS